MEALKPSRASFRLLYGHADISADVSARLVSVTYTDHLQGESDELEIKVEDGDGLWKGPFYPTKGDDMELWMGWEGEALLPCGVFQVDEMEASGPPDTLTIHGLAAGIKRPLRTRTTRAFEGASLRDIAQDIAGRQGLKLEGEVDAVRVKRATQRHETDLRFLRRLAEETGHVFAVRGDRLVFWRAAGLEALEPVLLVTRKDLKGFSLRDKTDASYKGIEVRYFSPGDKALVTSRELDQTAKKADVLKILARAEDAAGAAVRSKAELHRARVGQTAGTLTLRGDRRLVAGNIISLAEDMGAFAGDYQITNSRHTCTGGPSGTYSTEVGIRRAAQGVSFKAKKGKGGH